MKRSRQLESMPVDLVNLYARFYVVAAVGLVTWSVVAVILGFMSSAASAFILWFAGLFAFGVAMGVMWVLCVAFIGIRNLVRGGRHD